MRSRAVKMCAALLVLATVMGAESPGCKERGKVDTDRPAPERQVDPKKARIVLIKANSYGPYTVLVIAQQQGKPGIDRTGPLEVAGEEYRQTLAYTSGVKVEIKVTVSGSSNDVMICHIEDGGNRVQDRAYGRATCLLTTGR